MRKRSVHIAIWLMLLMFVSTTGINTFRVLCHCTGNLHTALVAKWFSDCCGHHNEAHTHPHGKHSHHENDDACCKKVAVAKHSDVENCQITPKQCCQTEVEYSHISDVFQQAAQDNWFVQGWAFDALPMVAIHLPEPAYFQRVIYPSTRHFCTAQRTHAPPLPYNRDLLNFVQNYRC